MYIHLPSMLILLVTLCIMFWKGTKYEVLFSRKNYIILAIIGVIDLLLGLKSLAFALNMYSEGKLN